MQTPKLALKNVTVEFHMGFAQFYKLKELMEYCSGIVGCKYFSKDYTFICDGESKWFGEKAYTKECDPRIDIGICASDLTKKVDALCTNCCAGKKGCNYFDENGTFICEGESEGENTLQKSNVAIS
uniref:Uncharacterized protein n=1 Tax=Solanum lycopersicum TaxID=4081 RepID=A0A3Q7IU01_SOLLC